MGWEDGHVGCVQGDSVEQIEQCVCTARSSIPNLSDPAQVTSDDAVSMARRLATVSCFGCCLGSGLLREA